MSSLSWAVSISYWERLIDEKTVGSYLMHIMTILGDTLGNQLFNGIFSLQFLQFLIAFLSYFGFVLTSAVILILAERRIMGWMQDRLGRIHMRPWRLLHTLSTVSNLLLKYDIL